MNKSLSQLNRFILLFIILLLGLNLLHQIPVVSKVHFQIFRTFEQSIFNALHPSVAIQLSYIDSKESASSDYDYSMNIYEKTKWTLSSNKRDLKPRFIANQKKRLTYLGASLLLISLVLASPVYWRRKLYGIIGGLLLLYLLLAMKFTYMIDTNGSALTTGVSSLWLALARLFGAAFRTNEFILLLMIPVWVISCLTRQVYKSFIYG